MNASISGDTDGTSLDTPLWVVVPAAGSGQRLGGELAKQYRQLDGIVMLRRTIERMLEVPGVAGVVVAVADNDQHWSSLFDDPDPRLHCTPGGSSRAASVLAGISYLLGHTAEPTWVLVHDAARPLVALSDIQRLLNAVYNSGAEGGLLATPVHDTLKRADDYLMVEDTVDRHGLWQAQTPQLFRAGALYRALQAALKMKPDAITDEASALELAGEQPLLVEALQPNFKITRPADWDLATAILQACRVREKDLRT